jgi:endo-1,4-beta-D-glucanase Y
MKLSLVCVILLVVTGQTACGSEVWPSVWKSYVDRFMDDQVRVIDHDADDRTTSEAQAYAMFFALVANDRSRFDRLLSWTERNLASGDLSRNLPAWLWGRGPNAQWGVLDSNSASDADLWMAYTLIEAGEAWHEPRYTFLGGALANRIAADEVVELPNFGAVLLPGAKGFQRPDVYRLNPSYLPLQIFVRLAEVEPRGPWRPIADRIPALVKAAAPNGFVTDWLEFSTRDGFKPSAVGSYDAIRVYLWAGLLDRATPGRDGILKALPGLAMWLRTNPVPPAKVAATGGIADSNGPIGFSAAVLPYLAALGETRLVDKQMARLQSAADARTGLYGTPVRYYDQNLALFAIGAMERRFWFDAGGALVTPWHRN